MIRRGLNAFLKMLDNMALKVVGASNFSAQDPPEVIAKDEAEFKKHVGEHVIVLQESRPNQKM